LCFGQKTLSVVLIGLFILSGCGSNWIVLEDIKNDCKPGNSSRLKASTGIPDYKLEKDSDGRWILDRRVIRDVVFVRALQNRIRVQKGLAQDRCLLDVLNDIGILVRKIGGSAILSPDAIECFANEIEGAEFIPWRYTSTFLILPAVHGTDVHLVFDKKLIRKNGIKIDQGYFPHRATLKETDGSMKREKFWVSTRIKLSVARKIRIHPPGRKKTLEGFGIALEGVAVQVIGKVPLQSLVVVTECHPRNRRNHRKVVAALEGLTIDKPPSAIIASSDKLLDAWIKEKENKILEQQTASSEIQVASAGRQYGLSQEDILNRILAGSFHVINSPGDNTPLSKTDHIKIQQAATPISLSIDYWYITLIVACCILYSVYRVLRPLAVDVSRLAVLCVIACTSLFWWGFVFLSTSAHKYMPLLHHLHLHGRK